MAAQDTTIPDKIPLTREAIGSGAIRELIRASGHAYKVLSDEELIASRRSLFPGGEITEDVWLFGYGSLIWNPTFHFAEKCRALVHGVHRRFCLWTHLGRGSAETPGLVLGLDRGGACRGLAFRVPADIALQELDLVWRREMVSDAYTPRWLTARLEDGRKVRAIGFVMDRDHPRYAGLMSDERVADAIARASGFLGPCSEYLVNTVQHLDELGMPDRGLHRVLGLVMAHEHAPHSGGKPR